METQRLLALVSAALAEQRISESASANLREWLQQPWYSDYRDALTRLIDSSDWNEVNELFWMEIPFGTAGRRGRMAPVGCNAINARTIGETVQALATYVARQSSGGQGSERLTCAIAYDTRHGSREFAETAAGIMVASGFDVFFCEQFRPTPLLSTTIRHKQCDCGIMISASHNPPSDNAIKVFWKGGAQLRPPHDDAILAEMNNVTEILCENFASAVEEGRVVFCAEEMDTIYADSVLATGSRNDSLQKSTLGISYSPLHGVGTTSIVPILKSAGFSSLSVFEPHAAPDGDFPNVPNGVANPENPGVFDAIIDNASSEVDIILATDPDADRIGCAARLTCDSDTWRPLTGNQIGVLLGAYLLERRRIMGQWRSGDFVVTTLVSSEMLARVADTYQVHAKTDVLTGFKWISKCVDDLGPEHFVFGFEEAHGYLAGTYARDKDGAIAALLLTELAHELKQAGATLHQQLDKLFEHYGFHDERTLAIKMPGADGMQRMDGIMEALRQEPPTCFGELSVTRVRDYLRSETLTADGTRGKLNGPNANLLFFDLERAGYRVGVRPSGTEPKIKFYLFGVEPVGDPLNVSREICRQNLDSIERQVESLVR